MKEIEWLEAILKILEDLCRKTWSPGKIESYDVIRSQGISTTRSDFAYFQSSNPFLLLGDELYYFLGSKLTTMPRDKKQVHNNLFTLTNALRKPFYTYKLDPGFSRRKDF